jgi:hypothetical protein
MGDEKPLSGDDVHQASNSPLEQADYKARKDRGDDAEGASARGPFLRAAPNAKARPARGEAAGSAVEIDRHPTPTPWGREPKTAAIVGMHNATVQEGKRKQNLIDHANQFFKAPAEIPDHDRPHLDRTADEMTRGPPPPKLDTFIPVVRER